MDSLLQSQLPPIGGATIGEFKAWLAKARAGDSFVYHCGFLALGANHLGEVMPHAERQRLGNVAHQAWVAAEQGRVHLLQRRLGNGCYVYFAVARPGASDR